MIDKEKVREAVEYTKKYGLTGENSQLFFSFAEQYCAEKLMSKEEIEKILLYPEKDEFGRYKWGNLDYETAYSIAEALAGKIGKEGK